jgi:hypothetical protein
MLRRGLKGYQWSTEDQAAYSAWGKYVLICYACLAAAIVIAMLAIGFMNHPLVGNIDNSKAVAVALPLGLPVCNALVI